MNNLKFLRKHLAVGILIIFVTTIFIPCMCGNTIKNNRFSIDYKDNKDIVPGEFIMDNPFKDKPLLGLICASIYPFISIQIPVLAK